MVYTGGMNYAMVNLKTDPELKKAASAVAKDLGVSLSAVLNNELRRFAAEKSVSLEYPEVPNQATAKRLEASKKAIGKGDYHHFDTNKKATDFLKSALEI